MARQESKYYTHDEYEKLLRDVETDAHHPLSRLGKEVAKVYLTIWGQRRYKLEHEPFDSSDALNHLLATSPYLWPSTPTVAEQFQNIEPATRGYIQTGIALAHSLRLLQAVELAHSEAKRTSEGVEVEVPLDRLSPQSTSGEELKIIRTLYAQANMPGEFENLFRQESPGAEQVFLDALAKPDVPLIAYTASLAQTTMKLEDSEDKQFRIGTLDTKIPGVRVVYRYPTTGEKKLQRSLLVESSSIYLRRRR